MTDAKDTTMAGAILLGLLALICTVFIGKVLWERSHLPNPAHDYECVLCGERWNDDTDTEADWVIGMAYNGEYEIEVPLHAHCSKRVNAIVDGKEAATGIPSIDEGLNTDGEWDTKNTTATDTVDMRNTVLEQ